MNKLVTIVLALFVSCLTNVKAGANDAQLFAKIAGDYTEPTGGAAKIRKSDDAKKESGPLRFVLSKSNTPGDWGCSTGDADFTFMEGPFKGQTYKVVDGKDGKVELHEQGGRKTVWTMVKKAQ